jgi:two-component system sensor histidine kinase KdpD
MVIMKTQKKSSAEEQSIRPAAGRLRIYLGYAAGVGKTYRMLEAARRRQADGVDLVVGVVHTHGRFATNALLGNLERIPRRRGSASEMDTDAILRRRPQLVLVDELAYTNGPGSRHAHRYQDVLELCSAGIDVYATLNIQQLAGLNDVVAKITGVTFRETVPDIVLDNADEIELVDLPIEELQARFAAGNVHISPALQPAADKFFRRGNLAALRELTLRRAADRIDEQMRLYMQRHDIAAIWPANERILVCVSPSPLSERLVRAGRRLARRLNAEWIAVFVETTQQLSSLDQQRVNETLRMAEALGAQTARINGRAVAETVVEFALSRNVTKIIAGKPLRSRWREWLSGGSIIDQIVRQSRDIDVYIIHGDPTPAAPAVTTPVSTASTKNLRGILLTVLLVAAATLVGLPLRPYINPTNLVILFFVAVMLAAVWLGRTPAIIASLLSVLSFDLIFAPPYYILGFDDAEYLLSFLGLLAVGLVISTLTAQAREQELAARRRERQTAALYRLSQKLAAVSRLADVTEAAVTHVRLTFDKEAALLLPEGEGNRWRLQAHTHGFAVGDADTAVADWAYRNGQPAGCHTETLTTAAGTYLPLRSSGRCVGVLVVAFAPGEPPLAVEQQHLLDSFASQIALALEGVQSAEQARQTRLLEETEKLQTALLNAISHDLRTPLAAITGSLSSLREDAALLSPGAQQDLINNAWEEAQRLNRLVGNLLDMTRLESGAMKVVAAPNNVEELVGAALAQMGNRLKERRLRTIIPDHLPFVAIDLVLMVQVVVNLLDNAVKYAPFVETITIQARQVGEREVWLSVADRGPGLPEGKLAQVFDRFFRLTESGAAGTGLGLSIAKGIVEAHHGRVWAENRNGGGAVFTISLPIFIPPARRTAQESAISR